MKAPSLPLLCEWVKSPWEALSVDSINESFVTCSVTSAIDGSENHKITALCQGNFVLMEDDYWKRNKTTLTVTHSQTWMKTAVKQKEMKCALIHLIVDD